MYQMSPDLPRQLYSEYLESVDKERAARRALRRRSESRRSSATGRPRQHAPRWRLVVGRVTAAFGR